jgi:3-hydroxyisobutyrate dehydrogenase
MRVAVLGTGIMGAGMARSAKRGGLDVVVWNRTRERATPLRADGIEVAGTVTQAVEGADAVLTMLFDTDATLGVKDELVSALGPDAVWVQAGTVGPDAAHRLAADVDRFVDAPVIGTRAPAESGTLVVLASGRPALVEAARPVFDAVGSRVLVVGDEVGQASALKLVVNSWVALIMTATAHSMAFARALGIDPRLFLDAVEGGPTGAPYVRIKGDAILAEDFTTSFSVDGVVKDVGLMVEAGAAAGFPTSLMTTVMDLFERTAAAGHGDKDMAAVAHAFES